ncbi:MAG: Methyl-accepting chemotaxis protein PctC [Pseudomonadota bacterium]
MLSKLKIGTRLTFGFGLVISVFLVALSVILSYQSQTLASARQIKNESLPFVLIAERMMLDVSQVGQFLTDVAVSHHTEGFDEADKNAQDFHDNAEKFKTMFRNENDTVALKKMEALQSQFSDFHALGKKMARTYIRKGMDAGNELMEEFDQKSAELDVQLNEFNKVQVDEANDMAEKIVEASTSSYNIVIVSAITGLIAGILISYLVARAIVAPVRRMQATMAEIQVTSDFSKRAKVTSQDEIGEMASAFNGMLDAQQQAMYQVNAVVTAIAEGDFSQRVDVQLQGDLKAMKDAVNASVNSVKATMDGLNAVMQALYNGQFDAQVNVQVKGEFKQAMDNATQAMAALNTMLEDVGQVMNGVAQGDLTGRVHAQGRGELAQLKDNLNSSLQALSNTMGVINQNTMQVATAANQFTTAIGQISDGVQNQKHAMSQVAAAVNQTSTSVIDVSRSTESASQKSREAVSIVQNGRGKMETMIEVVNNIATNSEKINKITEVIEGIANKTNLLSLNAAIEAARAGEHGKGFSVVAEEVGKLAESSAQSTQEITLLVQQAVTEAKRAVSTVQEVARDMGQIEASAQVTDGMLQRISVAMEQQSAAVEEINANISNLNQIAANNADAAEEITATVIELSHVADTTRREVGKFII